MTGRRGIVTAAAVIAGLRLWMQVRGTTKTPFQEWAVGFGALFVLLSLFSEISPKGAGNFALLVVIGDVLVNGPTLMNDVSKTIQNAGKPGAGPVFTGTPFATAAAGSSSSTKTPTMNGRHP